jgi:DNA-binding LacI/PurR family transcriptional regulator
MDGLASAGLSKFEKRYGDFTIASGFKAMGEIFDKFAPEAVFCANDYMAAGAMKYLHEKKINIPGDVAIVGYDNNDICLGLFPALTSVDNRFEELGQCLARELLALIEEKNTSISRVIKPVLVKRQSHLWTSKKCSKK